MLAYVFWHWPSPDHAAADYERLQREFHAALSRAAPSGFHSSRVFRVEGEAPWLAPAASLRVSAYADWYLLENSTAIDTLNVAAVSGVCEQPHAEVARAMAQGAGSLFSPRSELGAAASPDLASARHITFLTKPRPTPYPEFYSQVSSFSPSESTLWRRALVLGPTPEFALLTSTPVHATDDFHPTRLNLAAIDR